MTADEERKLHVELLRCCAQLFNCGETICVIGNGPLSTALDALWRAVHTHPWVLSPMNDDHKGLVR